MQSSRDPVPAPRAASPTTSRDLSGAYWFRKLLNAAVLCLGDVLALSLALTLSAGFTSGSFFTGSFSVSFPAQWVLAVSGWLCGVWLLHQSPNWGVSTPVEIKNLTILCLLVFVGLGGLEAVTGQLTWRDLLALTLSFLMAWPLVLFTRPVFRAALMRADLWGVPVVIYGAHGSGAELEAVLLRNLSYGYRPVRVVDAFAGQVTAFAPAGPASRQPLPPRPGRARADGPVALVIQRGLLAEALHELLDGSLASYERVIILPNLAEVDLLCLSVCEVAGVAGVQLRRTRHGPLLLGGKRLLDLVGVSLIAPSVLGLCLLIALVLWLETRTSPLFMQQRIGLRGQPFVAWKFRTMLPDAEEVLRRTLAENAELRAEWEANFKLRDDPRITRLGGFLRKTSLDELPQLLNVMLGDMSLIGPRPLPSYHCDDLPVEAQLLRASVRPGMTGLWQVSGRSDSGTSGMVRWDSYYVRNWSVWLDLSILIRTVQVVIRGSGAY